MRDKSLGDEVERFITEHIDSVYQLEILLLLLRTAPRDWNAVQIAAELRTNPPFVATTLDDLTGRRLLARTDGGEPTYAYRPATPELDSAVRALAKAYAERHIAVINLIFSKPPEMSEPVQAFADAFRFRKKDR